MFVDEGVLCSRSRYVHQDRELRARLVRTPSPLSPSTNSSTTTRSLASYSSVKGFDASAKRLYDFPDAPYLVELRLQLVDLAQYVLEAGYLGVGILDGIAGAVVLRIRRGLGLLIELHLL